MKNLKFFSYFAWFFLCLNIYTILGGAYVRATQSGAGCGEHWPLCNGVIIPDFSVLQTIIEFTHRVSSGIVGIGAVILLIWSFFATQKRSAIRYAVYATFLCVVFEALLGAGLVLFKLVANNSSLLRSVVMCLHLISTFALLASILFTAAWASKFKVPSFSGSKKSILLILISILGILFVGMSGGVTALGDTLFKPNYVGENLIGELSGGADHFLKSLRIYHPVFAIAVAIYTITLFWKLIEKSIRSRVIVNLTIIVTFLFIFQIICGFVNIFLLAPIWLQIVHLLLANILWIFVLLFTSEYLGSRESEESNN